MWSSVSAIYHNNIAPYSVKYTPAKIKLVHFYQMMNKIINYPVGHLWSGDCEVLAYAICMFEREPNIFTASCQTIVIFKNLIHSFDDKQMFLLNYLNIHLTEPRN